MAKYLADFELNQSSDQPIIRQVIIEEILQRRIQEDVLKAARGETTRGDIVKILNDSYARMSSSQDLLGISGKQRAGKKTSTDGSIAELNMVYSKTLEEFPDLEVQWEAEELVLLLRKYLRGELREEDFKMLTTQSFDEGKAKYDELKNKGLLDPVRDSLDLDNFGRKVSELPKFAYEPILQHIIRADSDDDVVEDEEKEPEHRPVEIIRKLPDGEPTKTD